MSGHTIGFGGEFKEITFLQYASYMSPLVAYKLIPTYLLFPVNLKAVKI